MSKTNTNNASQAEIRNLKEVLHSSNLQKARRYGTAAQTTKKDEYAKGRQSQVSFDFELPEDAAQRWMSNAQI